MAPFKAEGRDYIAFESNTVNGYEVISCTENVIGLLGNVISQLHIFIPEENTIITAYLLRQDNSEFQNIEEFLELRADFIKSYTQFLKLN